jgi:IS4 transposase
MSMDAVLKRFVEQAPVAVMARLGLQRAISAEWVDEVFEQHSDRQYTRELLFSTVVDLMSLVVLGLRPSLHAAAKKMRKDLPVSITALYDKVNRVEPDIVQALVRGSSERLAPVMAPLRKGQSPWLRGWRVRVVDGNHLPASEKRLGPLRGFRGAALPGHSLVVYDPDAGVVIDLVPCEDGHASERGLLAPLLAESQPRDLWIGDRLFCTRAAILSAHARGAAVLFRETKVNPNPTPIASRRRIGRIDTGVVYEQRVTIPTKDGAGEVELRRIELVLDKPTTDDETVIRLLTTLPKTVKARTVALLYRKRWTIEGLFGRLEAALQSEIRTLGYPRAALFAFGLAVIAFNVLAVIEAAVTAAHDLLESEIEVSTYYVADDIRTDYKGMLIAIDEQVWMGFDDQSPTALARTLRTIAEHVDPITLRKHPRAPKPLNRKGYASAATVRRHVATARVLRDGKIR